MGRRVQSLLFAALAVWISAGGVPGKERSGGSRTQTQIQDYDETGDLARFPREELFVSSHVDTYVLAEFDFDAGFFPDREGWVGSDLTAQIDTFFHVDDFAGTGGGSFGRLTPLKGSKSLWCGARASAAPQFCGYGCLPGYGNIWDQRFESRGFPIEGDAVFSYKVRWDSEAGYDFTYVEYRKTDGRWSKLPVNGGASAYDGTGERTETFVILSAEIGDTLRLRFRFWSDAVWSDEDCLWDSDGAVILDSLTVSDSTGLIDYQDFESESVGAKTTSDRSWRATVVPAFGDYSGLFHGTTVLQEDPCVRNTSYLWGFFKGSTTPYCGECPAVAGAAPGNVEDQPAVPEGKYMRPGASDDLFINNEIWSPPIDWTRDVGGREVPPTASRAILEFDVYRDHPLCRFVFHLWHIRSLAGGCPGEWRDLRFIYYGGQKDWIRQRHEVGGLVGPGTEQVQVAFGVIDLCDSWCIWQSINRCHSHGPLLDNVRLIRIATQGPAWSVRDIDLFQDNFASDGTAAGTVRVDMALDVLPRGNMNIRAGDSTVVTVTEPNYGLDRHISGDPSSGPAVYCHVRDIGPGKSGGAITGDSGRWPVVATGGGWTTLRFDTVFTTSGIPLANKFCVDLNDNLYTPGDTVWFYFSARDAAGNVTYWSEYTGAADAESWVRSAPMEMTCLPANALSGATDILYVDDFDGRGAQRHFDTAFRMLGIMPDRYDVRGPSSVVGNGPGSRVRDVSQQVTPHYRKILWNSGDLSQRTIGDGINPEKSNDFRVLFEFLDTHTETAGLYISGDHVADEWRRLSGSSAVNLRSAYMNFNFVKGNHVLAGEPVSPRVVGQSGSLFDHEGVVDTLIAYGGCPGINQFDVLQGAGASHIAAAYSNNASNGAVLAQSTPTPAGGTARVVLSGFSYHEIRDDRVSFPDDRVEHLRDILAWFDNVLGDPTAVDPTPIFVNALAQNFPNPFNPVTTIRYSIREKGHVSLKIYSVAGERVRTLVDGVEIPREGGFTVQWDGTNENGEWVSSGVYFYVLKTGRFSESRKMVLIK